jgi:hypothetical protein
MAFPLFDRHERLARDGLGGLEHVFLRRVKTLRKGAYRRATGQIVEPIRGRARDEIPLNLIAEPRHPPW